MSLEVPRKRGGAPPVFGLGDVVRERQELHPGRTVAGVIVGAVPESFSYLIVWPSGDRSIIPAYRLEHPR